VKNRSPNVAQPEYSPDPTLSNFTRLRNGIRSHCFASTAGNQQNTGNATAGLTVIPKEGLKKVFPAEAGKLEKVCELMGSTLKLTKCVCVCVWCVCVCVTPKKQSPIYKLITYLSLSLLRSLLSSLSLLFSSLFFSASCILSCSSCKQENKQLAQILLHQNINNLIFFKAYIKPTVKVANFI